MKEFEIAVQLGDGYTLWFILFECPNFIMLHWISSGLPSPNELTKQKEKETKIKSIHLFLFLVRRTMRTVFLSIFKTEGQEQLVHIIKTIKVLPIDALATQTLSDNRHLNVWYLQNVFALQSKTEIFFAIEIGTNDRYIGYY